MLKTLNIENIAVIEKANIEFTDGLNILTGETGAGKSIVIDAINAILGERTSKELVRHGADKAVVNAMFENVNSAVVSKLEDMGIDCEDDNLLLSRKISSQGKSTCRINGSPCTVSMLKEIGSRLVNIHGQHDSQTLLNPDFHYTYIDMINSDHQLLIDYKNSFKELIGIRRKLKALTCDEDSKDKQLELLNFQIQELQDANIQVGEKEELIKRRIVITNAQSIINATNNMLKSITGDDDFSGMQDLITNCNREIESFVSIDNDIKNAYELSYRISDDIENLKDIAQNKLDSMNYDPSELEMIEDRLDLLYQFSNKYGQTEQDMLDYLNKAIEKRGSLVNSDEELENLNNKYDICYEKTISLADKLSKSRKEVALKLQEDVENQLQFLDMPKIKFIVDFDKGNLSSNGYDKIQFLISTNLGEPPKPLVKIASGGELSRIMLAIKNIIAKNDTVGTLIFDEIDTGVSGRASRKIGLKLKSVSNLTQVICVTHSAQIAACANSHLLIQKQYKDNKTYTNVTPLSYDQKKLELARIMGGMEVTDALLKSAEELLQES